MVNEPEQPPDGTLVHWTETVPLVPGGGAVTLGVPQALLTVTLWTRSGEGIGSVMVTCCV